MFPPETVRELCRLSANADWEDSAFELEKACYCSLFAHAVYSDLPEFELKKGKRIAVVPCADYLALVAAGEVSLIDEYLVQTDLGPVLVIRSHFAIMAGVALPHVVIVAIRGTQFLHDWFVNLDFQTRNVVSDNAKGTFHRGFLIAAARSAKALSQELAPYAGRRPIYLTGHSLGGALAAVYNAVLPHSGTVRKPAAFRNPISIEPRSCYTFGMPRYGQISAMERFSVPYHIFNPGDLVPDIVPSGLLYVNCPTEFSLSKTGLLPVTSRPDQNWPPAQVVWQLKSGLANHDMELYRDLLFESLQK